MASPTVSQLVPPPLRHLPQGNFADNVANSKRHRPPRCCARVTRIRTVDGGKQISCP